MANTLQLYILDLLKNKIELNNILLFYICPNPNISWEFVCEHPEIDWNYMRLTDNPNITLEIIFANADKRWSNFYNQKNENTNTYKTLFCDKEWNYPIFNHCPIIYNIPDDSDLGKILKLYPDLNWNFNQLFKNLKITLDIINNNPKYNWNISLLSSLPMITWDIIQLYPNIDWDFNEFLTNPNLSWDILTNNLHLFPNIYDIDLNETDIVCSCINNCNCEDIINDIEFDKLEVIKGVCSNEYKYNPIIYKQQILQYMNKKQILIVKLLTNIFAQYV